MSKKKPKAQDYKALRKKWYAKLKKEGFKDIENDRGDLIDHQSTADFSQRIGFRAMLFEAIRDYYIWASDMIILGKFKSSTDRKIWVLHSMGRSSREIAESVGLYQTTICRKIKKIRLHLQNQEVQDDRKDDDQAAAA